MRDARIRDGGARGPIGVAYISHNTYPGWHFGGMIRDLMIYTRGSWPMPRYGSRRRAPLDFLSEAVSTDTACGIMLKDERNLPRECDDS